MAMASTALSIDSVLPAFGDIREAFGLAPDSTAVAGLITAFIIGNAIGLLPAGLLADRYGRRPVLWGGLALFIVGTAAAALAPTLGWMMAARFVWGLGSAGPRVAAMAMVRDAYEGERMARQMSAIMAVFILVPAVAPTLSTGLLAIGPWPIVYWMCAVAAVIAGGLSLRLPSTLPADQRTALDAGALLHSIRSVFAARGTTRYLIALTMLQGAFYAYLGSTELIVDETFGLRSWLPVIFGVFALAMGMGMLINGRIVERVGLDRLIRYLFACYVAASLVLAMIGVVTDGRPPFWLYALAAPPVLAFHGVLIPNLNSAAMRPLAHVAGVASALLGMIPGVFGALIGSRIDAAFDGTMRPLAFGFLGAGLVAAISTPVMYGSRLGPNRGDDVDPVTAVVE